MDTTDRLTQYCQSNKERKLVAYYLKNGEILDRQARIFTILTLIVIAFTMLDFWQSGFNVNSIEHSLWRPFLVGLLAIKLRTDATLSTILKRIAKNPTP